MRLVILVKCRLKLIILLCIWCLQVKRWIYADNVYHLSRVSRSFYDGESHIICSSNYYYYGIVDMTCNLLNHTMHWLKYWFNIECLHLHIATIVDLKVACAQVYTIEVVISADPNQANNLSKTFRSLFSPRSSIAIMSTYIRRISNHKHFSIVFQFFVELNKLLIIE